MLIKQSLIRATKILKKSKILSPALDAEILLAFAIKKPKEFLFAHPEKKLTATQFLKFKKQIARRAKHFPVAYLTGHKFFYGLDFFIDKNVLIPRPETETLVEAVINKNPTAVVDVGTGSGAIAITLAHHLPKAKIFATEISAAALKVARKNILHHKVAVTLLRGNLLEPLIKSGKYKVASIKYLLIVANLPYGWKAWKNKSSTETAGLKFEPQIALFTGKNGLELYEKLLNQIKLLITNYLPRRQAGPLPITSLFEIDPRQTKLITKLIKQHFPAAKIEIKKDLAGRDRIVIFKINPKK
jgi:release factor glutamine methyltransferase